MSKNDLFPGLDPFGTHCGIKLKEQEEGRAIAEVDIEPYHRNLLGIAHGGLIFTLADIAFAAASNYASKAVGVNVNISYFKGVESKRLQAEAKCVSSGRKISHYNIDITSETGTLVARLNAVAYNL